MASNPDYVVGGDRTVDAILKSIRSKVRSRRAADNGTSSENAAEIDRLLQHIRQQLAHGSLSAVTAVGSASAIALESQQMQRIETELRAALAAHRQFGQLNPRLPGFHNRALQSVKKVLRRSLTWYTRPLQQFQGAVLRSLQQVSAVLESHGESLQKVDGRLDDSLSVSEQQIANLKSEMLTLRSEFQALKEELRRTTLKGSD